MKALCWHGKKDIRCDTVPDPRIEHPRDAIIKVTSCAICGSDLHLFNGFIPGMKHGDIIGHEFMGEVVEVGAENKCEQCRRGDRRGRGARRRRAAKPAEAARAAAGLRLQRPLRLSEGGRRDARRR